MAANQDMGFYSNVLKHSTKEGIKNRKDNLNKNLFPELDIRFVPVDTSISGRLQDLKNWELLNLIRNAQLIPNHETFVELRSIISSDLSHGDKFAAYCAYSNPFGGLMIFAAFTFLLGGNITPIDISYETIPHIVDMLNACQNRDHAGMSAAAKYLDIKTISLILRLYTTATRHATLYYSFFAHFPELIKPNLTYLDNLMMNLYSVFYRSSNMALGAKYIKNIRDPIKYFQESQDVAYLEAFDIAEIIELIYVDYGILKNDREYIIDYVINHPMPDPKQTERYLVNSLKVLFTFRTHSEFLEKLDIIRGKKQGMAVFRPLSKAYKTKAFLNKPNRSFVGQVGRFDETGQTVDEIIDSKSGVAFGSLLEYGIYSYSVLYQMWSAKEAAILPWQNENEFPERFDNNILELVYHLILADEASNNVPPDGVDGRNGLKEFIRRRIIVDVNRDQIDRDWLGAFDSLLEEEQTEVIRFFKLYLEWGFYMRGWRGNPERLPLSYADTSPYTQNENADLASERLGILNEALEAASSNVKLMFLNAPFYRKLGDTYEKQPCTIGDDITRIAGGESGNVMTCIRMSSHAVLMTAHYYLTITRASNWYRFDNNRVDTIM